MSYPEISPDLQKELIRKVEFNNLYNPEGLYPHQEFVRRYLSPYTPYKGLLLFHNLGSGKSLICISVAVDHYLHDKKRCLIVTKGNSGTESFKKEIDIYYEMAQLNRRLPRLEFNKIFIMEHYMTLHNTLRRMTNLEIATRYSRTVFVLDEIHNVRRLKISKEDDLLGAKIYNSLERLFSLTENTRILLVTATPMTNDAEQLSSTMQLLTDKQDESRFHGLVSYNAKIKHKPKKIYHGEYGFLDIMKVYPSYMISHQREYHLKEQQKGVPKDIYRVLTHISLFCFPDHGIRKKRKDVREETMEPGEEEEIQGRISGEEVTHKKPKRTSLHGVKKTTKDLTNLYGRNIYLKGIMELHHHQRHITSMKTEMPKTIKYNSYRVKDSYRKWLKGKRLRECSSKYAKLMDIIMNPDLNKGPIFIYIEEVRGSGLLLLTNILEEHGFELYTGDHLSTILPKPRYTYCVGDQGLVPNKTDRLEGFNHSMNKEGKYVNILIGSKIIGESITLKNVRMFHVITIHWNDSTVEQAIGRVIRSGSHDELRPEDRTVDIYIHASLIKWKDEYQGTDLYKLDICNRKQKKITRMENFLKENAIDKFIGQHVGDLDSSTFLLYYMDRYSGYFNKILKNILHQHHIIRQAVDTQTILQFIVQSTKIEDERVATEILYQAITKNYVMYINKSTGERKYIREGYKKLYLVSDPSLPFFFVDPIFKQNLEGYSKESIRDESTITNKPVIPPFDKKLFKKFKEYTTLKKVEILRNMHFLERVSFVENIVRKNLDEEVSKMFKELFINYQGTLYHIMCYRIPGDAYTAVLPIPKPNLLQYKTRLLDTKKSTWRYIDGMDENERNIIESLERRHDRNIHKIDRKENMFMIISLIDNKSRLRTRLFETSTKGDKDKRFIRKGRCLSSILKIDLALLYTYIRLYTSHEFTWNLPSLDSSTSRKMEEYDQIMEENKRYIQLYGYNSMKEFKKENPEMYTLFSHTLIHLKTNQIVSSIEEMMISMDKFLFL